MLESTKPASCLWCSWKRFEVAVVESRIGWLYGSCCWTVLLQRRKTKFIICPAVFQLLPLVINYISDKKMALSKRPNVGKIPVGKLSFTLGQSDLLYFMAGRRRLNKLNFDKLLFQSTLMQLYYYSFYFSYNKCTCAFHLKRGTKVENVMEIICHENILYITKMWQGCANLWELLQLCDHLTV